MFFKELLPPTLVRFDLLLLGQGIGKPPRCARGSDQGFGRINPVETSNQFRSHLLGGIRWALGLAAGSSEPNPQTN